MLAEERFNIILNLLAKNSSVTVQELMEHLGTSESTIRRDLTVLDQNRKLIKVHGGAVSNNASYHTKDENLINRRNVKQDEKKKVASYAANLIQPTDFVYIDAGSTTELIVDYITETNATYVTNTVTHARKLLEKGCTVFLIGGKLKPLTEAIVGSEALASILKYNFTIGFWGTNGIDRTYGFTTPDPEESEIKKFAIKRCKKPYIVADSSKFNHISPITFAEFDDVTIITDSKSSEPNIISI